MTCFQSPEFDFPMWCPGDALMMQDDITTTVQSTSHESVCITSVCQWESQREYEPEPEPKYSYFPLVRTKWTTLQVKKAQWKSVLHLLTVSLKLYTSCSSCESWPNSDPRKILSPEIRTIVALGTGWGTKFTPWLLFKTQVRFEMVPGPLEKFLWWKGTVIMKKQPHKVVGNTTETRGWAH